jgi:ABC-2 type transport system permease protein
MFEQLQTIARNTFVESIRQPIYVVLILMTVLVLILGTMWTAYTLDDDNKMLIDTGLSMLFLAGLMLAAFTATGVLSREIDQKTVLTVVSKPVPRPIFVIGKYLGVAAAIGVSYWILAIAFLFTVRHQVMQTASDPFDGPVLLFASLATGIALAIAVWGNYFYRWVFNSTFVGTLAVTTTLAFGAVMLLSKEWQFQSPATEVQPQLMIGLLLVFEAVLLLTAVAVAASTRLGQVMTLVVCTGVFLLGLISNSVFGELVHKFPIRTAAGPLDAAARSLAYLSYILTPNLQFLWPADALTQGHDFTGSYVLSVSAYTVLYIAFVTSLAVALFQTREVG